MSYVTDILVLCSLEECSATEDSGLPAPLAAVNAWLEKNDHGTLARLDEHALGGGKAFQAVAAGAAFNFFPLEEFLVVVASQEWIAPESVQVLAKGEEDALFTLFQSGKRRSFSVT